MRGVASLGVRLGQGARLTAQLGGAFDDPAATVVSTQNDLRADGLSNPAGWPAAAHTGLTGADLESV